MATQGDNPAANSDRTLAELFGLYNQSYLDRLPAKSDLGKFGRALGTAGSVAQGTFGLPAEKLGLASLIRMLTQEGRVDPRLLARLQAQNSMRTQREQDAARAGLTRRGFGGGGISDVLNASIGAAGSRRAADIDYQDISDSYGRNQQNLGLLDQLVIQPQLGYASLGQQDLASRRDAKQKQLATGASLIGGGLGAIAR